MRVRFTEVGGVPTRYYEAGEGGPPLMLVHGAGISADAWLRNVDALGRDFTVVAPDTLGQGFTGIGDFDGGAPQPHFVAHLKALADRLGFDSFAMCGSSFGAMLCILTHFDLQDRVEKLILISSGSATLSEQEMLKSVQGAYRNGLSAMDNPDFEACRARLGRINRYPERIPEELVWMQVTLYARPGARENYRRIMEGLMDLDACRPWRVAERLHEIAAPTLMVWGMDDPRVIYRRAVEAADRIPRSTLVGIEACGHQPHIEVADRFNDLARRFLRGEEIADDRARNE